MHTSSSRQRGQAALEYLAMLAVVAAVVALVLGVQPALRRWVGRAGAAVASLGQAVPTAPPPVVAPARSSSSGGGFGGLLLDVAGAVPVAGDLIDVARCGTNLAKGRLADAALLCAAALPVAGSAATAVRVGRRADDVLDAARAACRANSFLPGTPVLGADGRPRPIEAVVVGDAVLATDPATGATSAHTVTDIIVGSGLKDLVRITTPGGSLTATGGHPFYVGGGRGWVDAAALAPGDALRSPYGAAVAVTAVARFNATTTVHNLTVEGVHTYYAGGQPVLVHNCHLAGRTADDVLPGLPSTAPKPLGLGSTGRTVPANLTEQLAMTEVRSAPAGQVLRVTMTDSRWPASDRWVKMSQRINGVEIHYVRNTLSGAVDDFKFVGGPP